MGSLSINAGERSKHSFYVQEAEIAGRERRWLNNLGVFVPWQSISNSYRSQLCDIYQGRVMQNFHRRRNDGELLPYTPYLYVKLEEEMLGPVYPYVKFVTPEGKQSHVQYRWKDGQSLPFQSWHTDPTSIVASSARELVKSMGIDPYFYANLAAAKLYGKGWDALTFIAELHLTVRLIRNVLKDFAKLLIAWRDEFKQARDADAISESLNQWLAGRYGWRILLYDIKDITQLFNGLFDPKKSRYKERQGQNSTDTTSITEVAESYAYYKLLRNVTTQYQVYVRGRLIADFAPNRITVNPLTTAWELTKYSFVIDWFYNIGSALNTLSFLATSSQYTAAHCVKVVGTRWVNYEVDLINGAYDLDTDWTDHSTRQSWEYRDRKPCIVSAKPSVHLNLNALKVIDLFALMDQILRLLTRR